MKTLKNLLLFVLFLACNPVFAQNGQYNIRLVKHDADFDNMKFYVDIELKATNENSTFAVSHQNYRFTFLPEQLANPQIDQELDISGTLNGKNATSTFASHTLKGSTADLVSYNVTHDAGEGYYIGHEEYTKVGRIVFDIIDTDADFKLNLNSQASANIPSITIVEKNNNTLQAVAEGLTYNITSNDFNVYVYLQGTYTPGQQEMSTRLNQLGFLPGQTPANILFDPTPAGHPFSGAPWNHPTTTSVTTYAPTVVDYVLLSLRTDNFSNSFVFKTVALLHKDGRVEPLEPIDWTTLPQTPLYVSIQSRNHMTVMSHEAIQRNPSGAIYYDFRIQNSWKTAAGFGQKEITPGIFGMYAGDIDHINADINGMDGLIVTNQNGYFGLYTIGDFNMDADVNGADKRLWSGNNGLSNFLLE